MTWTPSPADEMPDAAGIDSLRKLFGFNLSKNARSKRGMQSKGEETGQQSEQEHELQQQELKEERSEDGQDEIDPEGSELSVERQGDCLLPAPW